MDAPSYTNRRGQAVTVTVAFGLTITMLCLFTRLYLRWPWNKLLSTNDTMAIVATVFAICHAAAISVAVQNDFGMPLQDVTAAKVHDVRKAILVAQLFFYLCVSCATGSVIELMIQIKGPNSMISLQFLRYGNALWGLAGFVVMSAFLGSNPTTAKSSAFIVFGALGCLLQLTTFAGAAAIISSLNMKTSRKAQVLLYFTPCFAVITAFITSMAKLPSQPVTGDFTQAMENFEILSEVTIICLMVYCTATPLLRLGKLLQTGYSAPIVNKYHTMAKPATSSRTKGQQGVGDTHDPKSVTISKLVHKQGNPGVVTSTATTNGKGKLGRDTSLKHELAAGDNDSLASDSSRRIIVTKTVDVYVARDVDVTAEGTEYTGGRLAAPF